eukprot:scaffold11003_cov111-Isochrysis_galbana.AAC.1
MMGARRSAERLKMPSRTAGVGNVRTYPVTHTTARTVSCIVVALVQKAQDLFLTGCPPAGRSLRSEDSAVSGFLLATSVSSDPGIRENQRGVGGAGLRDPAAGVRLALRRRPGCRALALRSRSCPCPCRRALSHGQICNSAAAACASGRLPFLGVGLLA